MQESAMALPPDCWHEVQYQRMGNAEGMVQLLRADSGSMQQAPGL